MCVRCSRSISCSLKHNHHFPPFSSSFLLHSVQIESIYTAAIQPYLSFRLTLIPCPSHVFTNTENILYLAVLKLIYSPWQQLNLTWAHLSWTPSVFQLASRLPAHAILYFYSSYNVQFILYMALTWKMKILVSVLFTDLIIMVLNAEVEKQTVDFLSFFPHSSESQTHSHWDTHSVKSHIQTHSWSHSNQH